MSDNTSVIKGIEQGRANFAYNCALEGKSIFKKVQIGTEWFKDDKYRSYVEKVPMLIKMNGLGATFAFVKSKRAKKKNEKIPDTEENSKNAYDLIYKQVAEWLKTESKKLISNRLKNGEDLEKLIISLNSPEYRALTIEVLAFFNWLKRFAEGLIEEETENE
jgi:CRISPR-associated protein Cmr5